MNVNGAADVLALRNAVLQRNAALREVVSPPAPNALRGPDSSAPPSSFDATLQTALQKVNGRHLKVCSPDNDFSDISGTWATLHASTAPLAR